MAAFLCCCWMPRGRRALRWWYAAIKEEASPLIEGRGAASVDWLSLGELSKLIDTFKREGVSTAVMAGQVKHKQIFSAIRPDWRLAKVLLSLGTRNTDSLIGAVAKVLEDCKRHPPDQLDFLSGAAAGPTGSAHATRADGSGAERCRLRTSRGAPSGAL